MPICIECSYPVSHLYSAYSRADDRSQGKGVRLTQCPRCQRFADKYVEYDFVVIFIDLVLIKPQVYRHLLFNRLGRDDDRFDRSIIRLGVLLLLFDVYLTWARLEKDPSLATTFISRAPIIVQYLFFLTLNALATLAHHLTVRLVASIIVPKTCRYGVPETNNSGVTHNNGSAADTTSTPFPSGPPTPTIKPSPSSQALNTQPQASMQPKLTPNLAPSDALSPQDPSLTPQGLHPSASTTSISLPPPARPAPPAALQQPQSKISNHFPHQQPQARLQLAPHCYATPIVRAAPHGTLRKEATTSMLNAKAALSSIRDAEYSSSSLLEEWLAAAESSLRPFLPTRYLTGLFDVLSSLLSLGVVDTHLVLLSNIEALYILLGCGYLRAVAVAVAGQIARWAVQKVILGAVGVG
ncbi:Arv1 protein [Penicillium pulvis]|uniref:Arv1 protein n=1 Tax=Penicillium pulvis TaxID=1562058 RepID=UPI002549ADEE|nr:Arv1 protein [Penicillium pulvis]KAJ5784911.1 Arv1 protein [Penicillium pulvis]